MGNIITYLKWRGDLDFTERPFCDADNLVLSCIAYLDFSGIVGSGTEGITVAEASERYFLLREAGERTPRDADQVLLAMAQSRRYQDAVLSCYETRTNRAEGCQFAAIRIALGDGTYYLAYGGTDDSIVGWREDFSISYKVIPAQQEAVDYLKKAMTEEGCIYRVGGHSKGGNLAFYAGMCCRRELRERIIRVYSNDGPGISPERMVPEGYQEIREKLTRILPGYSVVGRLFEPDVPGILIKSSGQRLRQHDILTWQVEGDALCTVEEAEEGSRFYNQIFDTWIGSADMEQRETFTRDFFDALEANGAKTISQVQEGGLDGFGTILVSMAESQSRTKIVIGKFLQSVWGTIRKANLRESLRSQEMLRGILFILAGLVCLKSPGFAVQGLGMAVCLGGFFWSAKKLVDCGMRPDESLPRKRRRLVVYIGLISLTVFFFTHRDVLMVSGSLVFGVLFLLASVYFLKKVWKSRYGKIRRGLLTVAGVLLFFLGCVSLVTPDASDWQKIIAMGSVMVLYGMGTVLSRIYRSGENAGTALEKA